MSSSIVLDDARDAVSSAKNGRWEEALSAIRSNKIIINARASDQRWTFLHHAAHQGKTPVINQLLAMSADPCVLSLEKEPPLLIAIQLNNLEAAKILRKAVMDILSSSSATPPRKVEARTVLELCYIEPLPLGYNNREIDWIGNAKFLTASLDQAQLRKRPKMDPAAFSSAVAKIKSAQGLDGLRDFIGCKCVPVHRLGPAIMKKVLASSHLFSRAELEQMVAMSLDDRIESSLAHQPQYKRLIENAKTQSCVDEARRFAKMSVLNALKKAKVRRPLRWR